MKSFLKMLLASILGGALLLFIIFVVFASLISISEPKLDIAENTILKIDLNTSLVDRARDNPFASFDPLSGEPEAALGLTDILAGLNAAKEDPDIVGIYLDGGIPMGSAALVTELRNALAKFKESGKPIYGYSEILSQKGLYLATVADTFMVHPEGVIEFTGLSAAVTYYKKALDKLGVEPVVLRATGNKFKSAVEPFLTSEMTEANRYQLSTMLSSIWTSYLNDIEASTGVTAQAMNAAADTLSLFNPAEAVALGLIGRTGYVDEMHGHLSKLAQVETIKEVAFTTLSEYAEGRDILGNKDFQTDKIAIVIAQGGIEGGEGDEYTIGSQRIARAVRRARKDDKVKAIVLRVNSPGGSALASDVIWREIDLARKEKPVIASMGGLAASGGYYISCFADTIIAQPNTITGSIGAFGLFFTAEELLNEKLGINIETVTTNKYADLGTPDRSLRPGAKKILIQQVDRVYNTFKSRVAEGRGLSMAYVDSIGQGRVYTGIDAMELGLVDMMGGLETAVQIAAEKAGLETAYRVVEYPEPKDPLKEFIKKFSKSMEAKIWGDRLGEYAKLLQPLKELEKRQGLQMRMEYDLEIE